MPQEGLPKNNFQENDIKKSSVGKTTEKMGNLLAEIMEEAEKIEIKPDDQNENGELLASSKGPISNLGKQSELWWKVARTESFKQFFGDWQNDKENSSKILDINGEPLIVFRGLRNRENGISLADFYNKNFYSEFNAANNKSLGPFGWGVHTTPYLEDASEYAGLDNAESKGTLLATFINARTIKAEEPERSIKEYVLEGIDQMNKDIALLFSKKLLNYIPKFAAKEKWDAAFAGYTGIRKPHDVNGYTKDGSKSNAYDTDIAEIIVKDPNNILLLPSNMQMGNQYKQ